MQNMYDISSIINLLVIAIGIVAGLWTLRRSVVMATHEIHQQTAVMQQNAIDAMKEEIQALKDKLENAQAEIKRLNNLLKTIATIAKNRGFVIEFENDLIHVKDIQGQSTVTHIQENILEEA